MKYKILVKLLQWIILMHHARQNLPILEMYYMTLMSLIVIYFITSDPAFPVHKKESVL